MVRNLFLSCFVMTFSLFAFAKNPPLKFCYEDQDSFPWVLKDGSGLNLALIKMVAKKLDTEIQLTPVPWKRCLEDLKNNIFDGAFAGSYKTERLEFGVYPTVDGTIQGKPDESKRIHISEYALYVKKGNNLVAWDGKEIKGAKVIASLPAHSIIDFLVKMNVKVDDGTRLPLNVFEKLVIDRFDAAAIQAYRGDNILESHPALKEKIEKLTPPLEKKAYYVLLSKQLFTKENAYSKTIWDTIAEVRESADYKKEFEDFFKK